MTSGIEELDEKGEAAKAASRKLAHLSSEVKNHALHNISVDLVARQDEILTASQIDYKEAQASGMDTAMLDRLMLDSSRLAYCCVCRRKALARQKPLPPIRCKRCDQRR